MKRPEFSKPVRRNAFARAQGKCEECGQKLFAGNVEYHHAVEAFMGGEATLENCAVLCRGCHRAKTSTRAPVLAKTKRQQDKHIGIRSSSRPMAGGRSDWRKRTMNRGTVNRETGEPL